MPNPGPREKGSRAAPQDTHGQAPAPGAASPAPPRPAVDGIDRRRSTREPVITVGMIRLLNHDDAAPEQVLVTNVSLHGVGFRSTRSLAVGTRYHIEIGVGPLHLTSRCRIVRVKVRHDGTYEIGGEFC